MFFRSFFDVDYVVIFAEKHKINRVFIIRELYIILRDIASRRYSKTIRNTTVLTSESTFFRDLK